MIAATLLHSTGTGTWTAQTSGVTGGLMQVWGSSATDIYVVVNDGSVLHSTGDGTWTQQTKDHPRLIAIWGCGANDVYAAGYAGTILHTTGNGTWTAQQIDSRDIYVVGTPDVILHGP